MAVVLYKGSSETFGPCGGIYFGVRALYRSTIENHYLNS